MVTPYTRTLGALICGLTLSPFFSLVEGGGGVGLNFLVLGDWGGAETPPFTTDIEDHTAKQMAITAQQTDAKFVVALGDNFYKHGVKDSHSKRFTTTYTRVFDHLGNNIPWYVIGGNHDHYGNITAQVEYSQHNPVWRFPYYWHSHKFNVPGTNRTMKLVLVDTVYLCGNTHEDNVGDQPKGPTDEALSESQWSWLKRELKYSRDDYLLVGGHFPVYSIAEHGPTHCLVKRLKPMLEKYRANAYFCGHDHNLQHLNERHSHVHYFVVGSANYINTKRSHAHKVPKYSSKFFWADASKKGGFAHVSVGESEMRVNMVHSLGGLLHQVVMKPRHTHHD